MFHKFKLKKFLLAYDIVMITHSLAPVNFLGYQRWGVRIRAVMC